MRLLKAAVIVAALGMGGVATQAQAQVIFVGEESRDFSGGDAVARASDNERDRIAADGVRKSSRPRGNRPGPADPNDVTAGREIRDSKGEVIGKVEAVSMSAAIVSSPTGKVEVPLEAFGMNKSGLLLGLTRAEFETLVRDANK